MNNIMLETPNDNLRNVLFVSHSCLLYGAERSLLTLVKSLKDSNSFHPIVLLPGKGFLYYKLKEQDIEVLVHPYFNWISSFKRFPFDFTGFILNYFLAYVLAFKIKNRKIDIVYTNSLATPFGALLAAKINAPHIWHVREFVQEDLNMFFMLTKKRLINFVNKTTDRIIYNSVAIDEKFSKMFTGIQSHIIYNGFDFPERPPISNRYQSHIIDKETIQLLILGRVRLEKGQNDAIECLIELRKRGLNVSLQIVGKGKDAYIQELKNKCINAKVSEHVAFVGIVEDPMKYFKNASITLVPSKNEAFGRVVVEACSVGCPTIVSDQGGLKEIIVKNETGLIYHAGNILEMANLIEKLIDNKNLYNQISVNAKEDVREKFSVAQYVSGVEKVLSSLKRL